MSVSTRSTSLRRPGLLGLMLAVVLASPALFAAPVFGATPTGTVGPFATTATPVDTTVSAQADPIVWGHAGSVHVTVTSSNETTGTVTLSGGGPTIGSGSVSTTGTANVVIPAEALTVGSHLLRVRYAGDANNNPSTGSVTVQVLQAGSTTAVSVSPSTVKVHGRHVSVTAQVSSPAGTPSGSVEFTVDGTVVATAPVGSGGTATAQIGPFDTVGTHVVVARYTGNGFTTGSDASAPVTVVKATPTMTVDRSPSTVIMKKTRVVLDVALAAPRRKVTGDVAVRGARGGVVVRALSNGDTTFRLPVFNKRGKATLTVTYQGSSDNERVVKTISFKVVKHR